MCSGKINFLERKKEPSEITQNTVIPVLSKHPVERPKLHAYDRYLLNTDQLRKDMLI